MRICMKPTKKFRIFSIFLIFLSLFFIVKCDDRESIPVTAELSNYIGCKLFFPTDDGDISFAKECIEYEYDGEKVLYLRHINAGFYCDAEIRAEFEIEDNVIEIKEYHSGMADCYCLFDVEYEIENIKPGIYVIKFSGPLSTFGFAINLISNPQGSYCVDRSEYPWF